jgi:hypothetical protein
MESFMSLLNTQLTIGSLMMMMLIGWIIGVIFFGAAVICVYHFTVGRTVHGVKNKCRDFFRWIWR